MKVTVTLELRFDIMPDGSVWTLSNFHEAFWERYLKIFDQVEIVARGNPVQCRKPNSRRVDQFNRIIFRPLPFYHGPWGYLKNWFKLRRHLQEIEKDAEAIILRLGSPIGDLLHPILLKRNHPYAVEVVGDPYDTFAPGSINSPFRAFYRWWFSRKLKFEVKKANAVSYVTSVRLPERYPANNGVKVIFASSIELLEHQLCSTPRVYDSLKKSFRLISVGALEDWRKGPDIALHALKMLISKGHHVHLTWVGDGKVRPEVEALANSLQLTDHVTFTGQLAAGNAIFEMLDACDIFILPTRGEGLPRAMIEAMARGLICVGSDVGGIPELLGKEFIHPSDNQENLFQILHRIFQRPEELSEISAVNWLRSKNYLAPILSERRIVLYNNLRKCTDEWKKNSSGR